MPKDKGGTQNMAKQYDYDLFVIGAGSGGVRAARRAAGHGRSVAVAEDDLPGGTCVNRGCIPKKLLFYGAEYGERLARAGEFGWNLEAPPKLAWRHLQDGKDREVARLNGVYRRLLKEAGVTLLTGRARLLDAHTVTVAERRFRARAILVAVGGRPWVPRDLPGREHVSTSDDLFRLRQLPRRALIVGGGYIAVELAGILHGLGTATVLLYRGELFLRGFDPEIRAFLAQRMRDRGMDLRFRAEVAAVERRGDELRLRLADGDTLAADLVLYATGRRPNTAGMGLAEAGVRLDANGAVEVDEEYRSSVPSVYAIGDVIGRMALTPVALAEAEALIDRLYGGGRRPPLDYDCIPTAVFGQPNLAAVGLTEPQARQRRPDAEAHRSVFTPLQNALSAQREPAMIKVIAEAGGGRVLGAHMVGPDAAEIMQGVAVALKAGIDKAGFDATVGIHPTLAEEFVSL